jgi:ribonuclease HI
LKECTELLIPFLGPIFRATFTLKAYPTCWKVSTTVVLQKPGKPDYTIPKAYRPIALTDTIAKVLSSCVADTIVYHTERLNLLPSTHFGGRPGRTTTDALQLMIGFIKDQWRKGNVVSTLFLDVKAAFPSVSVDRLIHNLRKRGIPKEYTDWIKVKMTGRKTILSFDDFKSALFNILNGCDQGDPLSVVLYIYYNANLLDIANPKQNELALGYIDDVNLIKAAKTFNEANEGLVDMMTRDGGAYEWSRTHSSTFEIDKLQLMCFTRRRKPHPFKLKKTMPIPRPALNINGNRVKPTSTHRYLGVILDQELRFSAHMAKALERGMASALLIKRLIKTKTKRGTSSKYIRRLYKAVVIPRMLYALDIWYNPVRKKEGRKRKAGSVSFITKLARVQRIMSISVTGAMRTTPNDLLDVHADLLPLSFTANSICHSAAIRYATLGEDHPLHKPVLRARRYVKRHRGPLHELLDAFEVDPKKITKVYPYGRKPGKYPDLRYDIADSKEEAKERDAEDARSIKVYTDGSDQNGGVGAAAILYKDGQRKKTLRYFLGSSAEHTIHDAELVGVILGLGLLQQETYMDSAVIAPDSQAAIKAICQGENTKTAQFLTDAIEEELEITKQAHEDLDLLIRWVPGHRDIEGNEAVDTEAKKAATGISSPLSRLPGSLQDELPQNTSAARRIFREKLKKEHAETFRASPRFERFSQVDPSAPSSKYRKITDNLKRHQSSIITQLRTGHAPLNYHLHRIGAWATASCPRCGWARETAYHYLMVCPAYSDIRNELREKVPQGTYTFTNLLSHAKYTPLLLRYVASTGRFKDPAADEVQRPDENPE